MRKGATLDILSLHTTHHFPLCDLTSASAGRVVIDQDAADGLDNDSVELSRLQGGEAQLVLVLGYGPGFQPATGAGQGYGVAIHVALPRGPADLQTVALAIVAHVDVLHFTGY